MHLLPILCLGIYELLVSLYILCLITARSASCLCIFLNGFVTSLHVTPRFMGILLFLLWIYLFLPIWYWYPSYRCNASFTYVITDPYLFGMWITCVHPSFYWYLYHHALDGSIDFLPLSMDVLCMIISFGFIIRSFGILWIL